MGGNTLAARARPAHLLNSSAVWPCGGRQVYHTRRGRLATVDLPMKTLITVVLPGLRAAHDLDDADRELLPQLALAKGPAGRRASSRSL
jgi:hypothetical protein